LFADRNLNSWRKLHEVQAALLEAARRREGERRGGGAAAGGEGNGRGSAKYAGFAEPWKAARLAIYQDDALHGNALHGLRMQRCSPRYRVEKLRVQAPAPQLR
jgi:hypothetical protein